MQNLKPLIVSVLFFTLSRKRILIETRSIESRRYRSGRIIDCLQARPCIFQPGSFTGWGNEGVSSHENDLEVLLCSRSGDILYRRPDPDSERVLYDMYPCSSLVIGQILRIF